MRALMLVLAVLLAASTAEARTRTVLAVNLGWHVGIAFAAGDLGRDALPEIDDFPNAPWIEIGWGDAGFYREPDPGLGTMLAAALGPTPAVLHLVAMPVHPARYLPDAEVRSVPLDADQFRRLVDYVSSHMDRGERTRAEALGPGLYPSSRFYPALGEFSLDRTCNTWAAQALAAAGLAIDPAGVVRASTLMNRIARAMAAEPSEPPAPSDRR